MRRATAILGLLVLSFAATVPVSAQSSFTGTWVTHNFGGGPHVINLLASGNRVMGTISRPQDVLSIYDGSVSGNSITFKAISATGRRENTYTGRLDGDQITFTRAVKLLAGGVTGGAGIFGSEGPMEFVAVRDHAVGLAVPRPLLGIWRLDMARSTWEGTPAPKPKVPDVRAFISRPAGVVVLFLATIGEEGFPAVTTFAFKLDGNPHPGYNSADLAALIADDTPTPLTVAWRALNERSFETTVRVNGVVANTRVATVSSDGSVLTETIKNVNAQGQTTSTVTLVFDRVVSVPSATD